jgi:hypothetical protein
MSASRMRFVLFDAVVEGECRIRDSWGRRGAPAFRYFVFQILFALTGFISVAALIGLPILAALTGGLFQNASQHIVALVLGGIVVGGLFLVLLFTLVLIQVLTKDFVVPQMALEDVSVSDGWSRLWSFLKADKVGYAGYIGMKIVLRIAASIVLGIMGFIALLLILIPFGGIGLIGVLAGRAAGLEWNPLTIAIAIVFGTLAVLALILLGALISVPAVVFFPAYSMYFFAERYPPLHALLYPRAPEPDSVAHPYREGRTSGTRFQRSSRRSNGLHNPEIFGDFLNLNAVGWRHGHHRKPIVFSYHSHHR